MKIANAVFVAGMFLLLLAPLLLAEESSYVSTGKSQASTYWGDWKVVASLAVFTSIMILALIYSVAHAFSLDQVKRWVAGEATQALASALIIGSLILLVGYGLTYVHALLGGLSDPCIVGSGPIEPIDYAQCKIQDKITILDRLFAAIYNANRAVEAAGATCYSIANIQFYCGDWSLRGTIETAHLLSAKITPLLVNLNGQYVILDYIRGNMFLVFLPLGVLLRTFPPTRGLGGLFIAVAIGFYVVFPILLIIGDFSNVNAYIDVNMPESTMNKCYTSFAGCSTLLGEGLGGGGAGAQSVYQQTASQLAQLTIGIMLYPFIAFGATIVFINSIAPILGGDAGMISRMAQKVIT